MKKIHITFLQIVLVLIGIAVLGFLIWEPHMEGVNANATTFSEVYLDDPFLLYVYVSSVAFFVGLYNAFRLLGNIRKDNLFLRASVQVIQTIRRCALITSALIAIAAVWIRMTANLAQDDPAGFMSLSMMLIVICLVIASISTIAKNAIESMLGKLGGKASS